MTGSTQLAGRIVLLVEDDYFIADEMRETFARAGAEILGPVGRVDEAMALIAAAPRIDGAVLDINLHDEKVHPVADALRTRGVPFIFATGYEQAAIPARFADVQRCEKPVDLELAARALFGRSPIPRVAARC